METVNGRVTKVPYNPRNGFRAAVDKPGTFASLDSALAAVQSGAYSGVGVNISGNVGGIDVDRCVSADGTLSDTAEAVLALFPEAHVEYSPSRHGLHLYFIVPEGFAYDVEDFYINCGKYGLDVPRHSLVCTNDRLFSVRMTATRGLRPHQRHAFIGTATHCHLQFFRGKKAGSALWAEPALFFIAAARRRRHG
jgi:putative DNA primase/helicase